MSYSYERVERRRTATTGGSSSYGHSGRRSALGYWVPLILTITAATIGLAAWVWSERKDDEDYTSEEEHYPGGIPPPGYAQMSGGLPPGPGPGGFQGPPPPGPSGDMGMGAPPMQGGFVGGPPPPGMGPPPPGAYGGPPGAGGFRGVQDDSGRSTSLDVTQTRTESTWVNRMTNAVGLGDNETANWAGNQMAAGIAAAGAMVGVTSLASGEEQNTYSQYEKRTEQEDVRDTEVAPKMGIRRQGTADEFFSGAVELPKRSSLGSQKRKTVAIVVSAVVSGSDMDVGDHASSLSHLPEHIDSYTTRVFILIYAPELKAHPLGAVATRRTSQSMASSFSNISQADARSTPAQTPGDFPQSNSYDAGILSQVDPNPIDESSSLYKTLHNQAQAIVERDSMILPFTTPNGHKHILKSLAPEIVYVQESLSGDEGALITDLSGWVRQIVVIIGDEGGTGGLIDTEDEDRPGKEVQWWQREERTGVGRGVSVVESVKIGDDWRRRVGEAD